MPSSQVDIGNAALARIGQDVSVAVFGDRASKASVVLSRVWARVLDTVLGEHPWPFTVTAVAMALDTQAPFPGWAYRYALPDNCLTALAVCTESGARAMVAGGIMATWPWPDAPITGVPLMDSRVPFDVVYGSQQACVATDLDSAYLVYSARVTDVGRYPPLFVDALVCRLAMEIAPTLAGEMGLRMADSLQRNYEQALSKAIAHGMNAYRDTRDATTPAVASRGGY